jgi:hypothetical protein
VLSNELERACSGRRTSENYKYPHSQDSRLPDPDSNKHVPNISLKDNLQINLFRGSENGRHLMVIYLNLSGAIEENL